MDEQNPGPARILVVDDERGPRESLRGHARRVAFYSGVLGELRRYAGVQFDPTVAKDFVAILESGDAALDLSLLADNEPRGPEQGTHDTQGW